MRAKIKKRRRNRTITWAVIIAVIIAVVIVVAYYLATFGSGTSPLIGTPVSSQIYGDLEAIAQSSNYGPVNSNFVTSPYVKVPTGLAFSSGKPIILFIGAEYCPLCAFQRWPLTIALMRFGNVSGLNYMQSTAQDVDPNTYTFSYLNLHYSSNYFTFQRYEAESRVEGQALQTVPTNYSTIFASAGGGYPFIDFNNKYAVEGSYYYPDAFAGMNWTQIIKQIQNPNSQISNEVMTVANALTALICNLTGGSPTSVCSNPSITSLHVSLAAYRPGASVTAPLYTSSLGTVGVSAGPAVEDTPVITNSFGRRS